MLNTPKTANAEIASSGCAAARSATRHRSLWALAALAISAVFAFGQSNPPRDHVVLAHPPPTPTPTPQQAPTGAYFGGPNGTVTGNGRTEQSSLSSWTITINSSSPCADCDPDQYLLDGATYSGIQYQGTPHETGVIFGVLNPSTRVVSFNMLATNCSTLNPSGIRVSNPGFAPTGFYYGGAAGEVPGPTLQIHDIDLGFGVIKHAITGRISGRDCFNQIIVTDVQLTQ